MSTLILFLKVRPMQQRGRLSPPHLPLKPGEKFLEADPNQGPFNNTDCCKLETPVRSHAENATIYASEPSNPLGIRNRELYMSHASKMPPGRGPVLDQFTNHLPGTSL
jgi:hypothetical protein